MADVECIPILGNSLTSREDVGTKGFRDDIKEILLPSLDFHINRRPATESRIWNSIEGN